MQLPTCCLLHPAVLGAHDVQRILKRKKKKEGDRVGPLGTPFVEAQKRGIDAEKCRGGEKSIRAEIPARLAVKAEDAFGADVGLVSLRARRVPCRDVVLGCLRSACGPLA